MVYGYLRVSTDTQDVEAQKIGITAKAESLGFTIDKWIEESGVSGTVDFQKRKLGKLMKILKEGDVIIGSEISRFARKLFLLFEFLGFVTNKKVQLWTVKDNYCLDGSLQSTIMAFAFGIAAQIERDMISQRTKEGLQQRRLEGVVLGRPMGSKSSKTKATPKHAEIEKYAKLGLSYSAIGRLTKLHRLTVSNYCKENGIGKNHERYVISIKAAEKRVKEAKLIKAIKLRDNNITPELIIQAFKENFYSVSKTANALEMSIAEINTTIRTFGLKPILAEIQIEAREKNPSLSAQGKSLGLSDTRDIRRALRNNQNSL
jgi:DNA invertase Pin-like site-specific DNA recombinase